MRTSHLVLTVAAAQHHVLASAFSGSFCSSSVAGARGNSGSTRGGSASHTTASSRKRRIVTELRGAGDSNESENPLSWLANLFGLAPMNDGKAKGPEAKKTEPEVPALKDAVLVVGATGKTGKAVVEACLASGRSVVGAVRTQEKADEALGTDILSSPAFRLEAGCDVTADSGEEALPPRVFEGVSQVVIATGPLFGEPEMTSEKVDYQGALKTISAVKSAGLVGHEGTKAKEAPVVTFTGGESDGTDGASGGEAAAVVQSVDQWASLDDRIMGGQSVSAWKAPAGEGQGGVWSGVLRVEGGGFCGTVVKDVSFDGKGFDGIRVRVRGDGNRYKFRLKPQEMANANEYQYQAPFNTRKAEAGAADWQEVDLPFDNFVAVRRNDVIFDAPKVHEGDGAGKMASLGIVFSRFEFNELPNPRCTPGDFRLEVLDISLYKKERPSLLMVSSAGTERFNRLSVAQRMCDIPIVQLNPQGVLSWKYKAENAMRLSGVPYTIFRATGLLPVGPDTEEERPLEVGQQDIISGRMSRKEVGSAVAAALDSPSATGTTFEIRRDESEGGSTMRSGTDFTALYRRLVPDNERSTEGMMPFPQAKDAPPPVTEEEKQRILADPRVKAQLQRTKDVKEAREKKQKEGQAASGQA